MIRSSYFKFFKVSKVFLSVLVTIFFLVGCSDKPQSFVGHLNEILKPYDTSVSLVKPHGVQDSGYCVVKQSGTGNYVAFNIDHWRTWNHQNGKIFIEWESVAEFLDRASGTKDIVNDLTDIGGGLFYSSSLNMTFEETSAAIKDLEKYGAELENLKMAYVAENLSAQFGLSEERAMVVAKLYNQWNLISKKRAISSSDLNEFSKQLTGLSYDKIRSAYSESREGNKMEMDAVFKKAAEKNGTTPEAIGRIINDLVGNK
ncbi:MAG: hypothetical protein HQK49_09495 [Oligoflexia bacterium]|nr:hypothetical protein [Oligoflexia bacterium]